MLVRRALHAAGYRFRIHERGLPGTPDLAFTRRRVATVEAALVAIGWRTIVVWECELRDVERAAAALMRRLGPPRDDGVARG
jgi:DNA mismatch endonuclease (patch repair protein)